MHESVKLRPVRWFPVTYGNNTTESDPALRSRQVEGECEAELRAAWGQWIGGQQWSHFVTFTFRDVRRALSTDRACQQIIGGTFRATGSDIRLVLAGEYGSKTGRYHLHGLLRVDAVGHERIIKDWKHRHGLTHDRRYDSTRGAGLYVAKYVIKEAGQFAEITIGSTEELPRARTATSAEEAERLKSHEKIWKLEQEITYDQETPLSKEEKGQIKETLRQEKRQLNARYKADCEWLDVRRMTGYDRYLSERDQ